MAKFRVTFELEVETDDPLDTAVEIENNFDAYEGWQIFGENGPLADSVISNVSADEIP